MSEKVRMVCAGIYALDLPFRCFDVVVMKVWCYCTNSNLWLRKARELYQMQICREVTITLVKRMMLHEQKMGRELCKWRKWVATVYVIQTDYTILQIGGDLSPLSHNIQIILLTIFCCQFYWELQPFLFLEDTGYRVVFLE